MNAGARRRVSRRSVLATAPHFLESLCHRLQKLHQDLLAHSDKAKTGYRSPGLIVLNNTAAATPPSMWATMWIQMKGVDTRPMIARPTATAGLKAPPETPPTAKAAVMTVNPIARPKNEFPDVLFAVAAFNTT